MTNRLLSQVVYSIALCIGCIQNASGDKIFSESQILTHPDEGKGLVMGWPIIFHEGRLYIGATHQTAPGVEYPAFLIYERGEKGWSYTDRIVFTDIADTDLAETPVPPYYTFFLPDEIVMFLGQRENDIQRPIARVYKHRGEEWTLETILSPRELPGTTNSKVGLFSGVAAEGMIAINHSRRVPGNDKVWFPQQVTIFEKDRRGNWEQRAVLSSPHGDDTFAALELRGDLLACVGHFRNVPATHPGVGAWIYQRGKLGWRVLTEIWPPETPRPRPLGGRSGSAGIIMAQNHIALISRVDGTNSIYVFKRSDRGWHVTQRLLPETVGQDDEFPRHLGLTDELLVAGALLKVDSQRFERARGHAYVFFNDNGLWREIGRLYPSPGNLFKLLKPSFGMSGRTVAMMGEYGDQSAVYVFELDDERIAEALRAAREASKESK